MSTTTITVNRRRTLKSNIRDIANHSVSSAESNIPSYYAEMFTCNDMDMNMYRNTSQSETFSYAFNEANKGI